MHTGPWVRVHKPLGSEEEIKKGVVPLTRIHDDESAQRLGFKEGIVGGLDLAHVTIGAIDASFGHTWYEGGAYSVRHKTVTYAGDFRVVWELVTPDTGDKRKLAFHVEDRNGNLSTYGWASVSNLGDKPISPWERNPPLHKRSSLDAVPEMVVGSARPPFKQVIRRDDVIKNLDKIHNQNWWYHIASPWGDPIQTPLETVYMLYQGIRNDSSAGPAIPSRLPTPMDAGTDIVVYHPLFLDRTYILKSWLCDKWQSEKAFFFCTECSCEDENGELVAIMRVYSAHLIADIVP